MTWICFNSGSYNNRVELPVAGYMGATNVVGSLLHHFRATGARTPVSHGEIVRILGMTTSVHPSLLEKP